MTNFESGDWVTVNDGKPHQFKRFTKDLPEWNKSLDYENVEMLDKTKFHVPNFDRSIVKLWQPKEGEWCWFKSYGDFPVLVVFTGEVFKDQFKMQYGNNQYHWACKNEIEPFIGKLPSWIKENQSE